MDRAPACGAGDTSSIPVGRTFSDDSVVKNVVKILKSLFKIGIFYFIQILMALRKKNLPLQRRSNFKPALNISQDVCSPYTRCLFPLKSLQFCLGKNANFIGYIKTKLN